MRALLMALIWFPSISLATTVKGHFELVKTERVIGARDIPGDDFGEIIIDCKNGVASKPRHKGDTSVNPERLIHIFFRKNDSLESLSKHLKLGMTRDELVKKIGYSGQAAGDGITTTSWKLILNESGKKPVIVEVRGLFLTSDGEVSKESPPRLKAYQLRLFVAK